MRYVSSILTVATTIRGYISVYDRSPRQRVYRAWIVFRRGDKVIAIPIEMYPPEIDDIFKIVFPGGKHERTQS